VGEFPKPRKNMEAMDAAAWMRYDLCRWWKDCDGPLLRLILGVSITVTSTLQVHCVCARLVPYLSRASPPSSFKSDTDWTRRRYVTIYVFPPCFFTCSLCTIVPCPRSRYKYSCLHLSLTLSSLSSFKF
jgi:hypothetical protein